MQLADAATRESRQFPVHRDLKTVRNTLRRIRRSEPLADLCLFRRRSHAGLRDRVESLVRDRRTVRLPISVTVVFYDGEHAEPIEDQLQPLQAETRDISLRGIGFAHTEPLQGYYAVVTLALPDEPPVSLLMEFRWSNVRKGGAFLSGGRFLAIVEIPPCR